MGSNIKDIRGIHLLGLSTFLHILSYLNSYSMSLYNISFRRSTRIFLFQDIQIIQSPVFLVAVFFIFFFAYKIIQYISVLKTERKRT